MPDQPLNLTIPLAPFTEVISVPGTYLNDHCLVQHQGIWHCFAIRGPVGKSCYDARSESSFLHASSPDLRTWTIHDDVLPVTGAGPDSDHVFAPSVLTRDGTHYMLYTGVDGLRRQRVCLATSTDLHTWQRHPGNPVITPSQVWARWPATDAAEIGNCRDSHIMQLPEGRFIAYWVAETNDRVCAEGSCIMASISDDLVHWQEAAMVALVRCWEDPPTRALESPCVVEKDDCWWLFYKYGWSTWCVRGRHPLDFLHRPAFPIGYAHAAEVFHDGSRWMISHCSGAPDDPCYRTTNRTRGLFLANLDWPSHGYPAFDR